MLNKRSISTPVLATFIAIAPNIVMAAEESTFSLLPPIWPFIAIILFIIVFRKQLNCVPPFDTQEEPAPPVNQEQVSAEAEIPTAIPDTEPETETETNDSIINLKGNSQQCQASTAKGARCKRKTTLEDTTITIDKKNYLITVCRQHNTNALKLFKGLI